MKKSIVVLKLRNREIAPYLSAVGVAGQFARYVASRSPDTLSLAAIVEDRIQGVAVSGVDAGLYEAWNCWLFANEPDVVSALLPYIHNEEPPALNFPLAFWNRVAGGFREATPSIDRLHVLLPSAFRPVGETDSVIMLSSESLAGVDIPDEMHSRIGRVDELPHNFPLYGIVHDNRLCAVADSIVRDSYTGAIQQVYTLESARREGLARTLVSALARDLFRQGLMPTYLVEEMNTPSVALAESLGFTLDSRWGYVDLAAE